MLPGSIINVEPEKEEKPIAATATIQGKTVSTGDYSTVYRCLLTLFSAGTVFILQESDVYRRQMEMVPALKELKKIMMAVYP